MGLKVWGLYIPHIYMVSLLCESLKGPQFGWTSCHVVFHLMFWGCRLFDGFEVRYLLKSPHSSHQDFSSVWSHTATVGGLRHDWSPSYTGHIYTDPPWGEWAHQRKGGVLIEALTHLTSVGFLPWVGSLVGLHMWNTWLKPFPHSLHIWGSSPTLQLLLKFKITAKAMPFPFSSEVWPSEWWCWALGCVPHKVFSTIIVARCHLAFVYFLITMVMRDHSSWRNDHTATVYLCQFVDTYSDTLTLWFIFPSRSLRRSEFEVLDCWHHWNSSPEAFPQFSSSATQSRFCCPHPTGGINLFSNLDLLLGPGYWVLSSG